MRRISKAERGELARLDKRLPPERAAYHEAAHVVIACCLRVKFRHVTIKPKVMGMDYIRRGHVAFYKNQERWPDHSKPATDRETDNFVTMCMAGLEADRIYTGRKIRKSSASNDYQSAVNHAWPRLARYLPDETTINLYLELHSRAAHRLLSTPEIWRLVEAVAGELVTKKTLTRKQVQAIIEDSTRGPKKAGK